MLPFKMNKYILFLKYTSLNVQRYPVECRTTSSLFSHFIYIWSSNARMHLREGDGVLILAGSCTLFHS